MDRIPERIDSRFRYVLLAAERAEQLMKGGLPKIQTAETKPIKIAMAEVATDLVGWDYGPAPEVEASTEQAEEVAVEGSSRWESFSALAAESPPSSPHSSSVSSRLTGTMCAAL